MEGYIEGSEVLQQICSISFLFVGLDWKHDEARSPLSGLTHDLDWFRQLFSMARDTVAFYSLPGFSATLTTIYTAILNAFKRSQLQTAIVLYFVGHSNDLGAFELYDGSLVRASTLVQWITEIRKQTKHLPVWIILDHCRPNLPASPAPRIPADDIYVLWACSPGQSAGSVAIDSNLPSSSLLQALFLTMDDLLNTPGDFSGSLLDLIDQWMLRVVYTTRGIICEGKKCPIPWRVCPCSSCASGGCCRHSTHSTLFEPVQNVVGVFWGLEVCPALFTLGFYINTLNEQDAVNTTRLLTLTRPIRDRFNIQIGQIAQGIRENMWFRKYVGCSHLFVFILTMKRKKKNVCIRTISRKMRVKGTGPLQPAQWHDAAEACTWPSHLLQADFDHRLPIFKFSHSSNLGFSILNLFFCF